jgi:hypothetical protein
MAEAKPTIVYMPSPELAVDESKEKARRQTALTKIKRYRESFDAVRAMHYNESWSTEALESHLEDIRIMISSKTSGAIVKAAYIASVKGVEVASSFVGMKTYGLADLLSKNSEVDDLLKEVSCEMGVGHVPATTRLALATLRAVFVLDSMNKRAELLGAFKKEEVNVGIKNKYSDI